MNGKYGKGLKKKKKGIERNEGQRNGEEAREIEASIE